MLFKHIVKRHQSILQPPTMKMHAIIEKTAAFISKQGSQMEIVIAAKQKNNPQFGFLNFGHELNVYYKHLVRQIQKGKYKPKPQESYSKRNRKSSGEYFGFSYKLLYVTNKTIDTFISTV